MKNTKLTQNLDNSKEQQDIQSPNKRKILASIGVTSGVIGASALSQQWTKPIVNSIVLPAHAEHSPGHTAAPTDAPDPTTTMAPPPMPMIDLSTFPASKLMGNSLGVVMSGGDPMTVRVALSVMPTAPVKVTLDGATNMDGGATLMFDDKDYMDTQNIMITAGAAPADMEREEEAMVTLMASGGNYDDVEAELTYTVGYYGADPVSEVEVDVTDRTAPGMATVTWGAPSTRAMVEEYKVTVTGVGDPKVEVSGTMAMVSDMSAGTASVVVGVLYEGGTAFVNAAAVAADDAIVG